MTRRDIVLTVVTVADCDPCAMAIDLGEELVGQNRPLAIDLVVLDVDADGRAVRKLGATSHPTMVLSIGGLERARLAGPVSKRRLLHKVLPLLYPDEQQALAQLQRQLGSPGEQFHRRGPRARVRQAEKARLLRSVPLFESLSKRDLTQLARLVDEIHRDSGTAVTEQGEPGDEFFVVVEGEVEVRRGSKRIGRLGPGEWFGEMSLLDDQPRSASVTATDDSVLLTIHRTDFDRLLASNPALMRTILTALAARLR
ncbi:MAG: cyclic nucleotide-binding domain-containing protein [Acidimicrobiia bacterium]|nr:cyclic nucleotide-binding domain-containing protein [Acidimicrobiia bacterium]